MYSFSLFKRLTYIIIIIFIFQFVCYAEELKQKRDIVISSDSLVADKKTNSITFKGSVTAKTQQMTLHSDKMIVMYGHDQTVKTIHAIGNVEVEKDKGTIYAEDAFYDKQEETIIFTGQPKAVDGKNVVTGKKITYFIRDGRVRIEAGKVSLNRVPKEGEEKIKLKVTEKDDKEKIPQDKEKTDQEAAVEYPPEEPLHSDDKVNKRVDQKITEPLEEIVKPLDDAVRPAAKKELQSVNIEAVPFTGHEDAVYKAAFSPDGVNIVSGSWDKTVRLWDSTGLPVTEPFRGHQDAIYAVAFSPDGKIIASSGGGVNRDNTIRLWDLEGNPIGVPFEGHTSSVTSLAFSPDGNFIASGSGGIIMGKDNTVRLWDLSGNPLAPPFKGHNKAIFSIAFNREGTMIASGSWDKTIRLWSLNGTLIGVPLRGHNGEVNAVAFSPDGQLIASGSADNTIRLWNLDGTPHGLPFVGHKAPVYSVAFSPDGKMIASGSWDKTIMLWDLKGNLLTSALKGHNGVVSTVSFDPKGKKLLSCSWDKTIRLWDLTTLTGSGSYFSSSKSDKIYSALKSIRK